MKKILLVAIVYYGLLFLFGCDTVPVDVNSENSHRIIGKEYNVYAGCGYQIIEVDGIEYLTTTSGGVYPLVKDTIK